MMILSSCHLWWSPEKQLSTWALASLWRLVLSLGHLVGVWEQLARGLAGIPATRSGTAFVTKIPNNHEGKLGWIERFIQTHRSFSVLVLLRAAWCDICDLTKWVVPYSCSVFIVEVQLATFAIVEFHGFSRTFWSKWQGHHQLKIYWHTIYIISAEAPAHPAGEILAAGSYPTSKEIPGSSSQTILWNSKLSRFQSWNSK